MRLVDQSAASLVLEEDLCYTVVVVVVVDVYLLDRLSLHSVANNSINSSNCICLINTCHRHPSRYELEGGKWGERRAVIYRYIGCVVQTLTAYF